MICAVAWVPYLLLRKSPKRWWLYTGMAAVPLMIFVVFVSPLWIDPLYNDFGPMQDKALETKILALAERSGIEGGRVYEVNASADTNAVNAYVTGFMGSKRIVLWDTTIKKLQEDELLFIMAHEMGHYVLGHVAKGIALFSVVILVVLYLIHRTAGVVIGRFKGRFGFEELSDIASLPLIIVLVKVLSLVITPVVLTHTRHIEHESDRFGLEITHDNNAAARSFVALQEENLGYPRPGLLYKIWRSSHPTLGDRFIVDVNTYLASLAIDEVETVDKLGPRASLLTGQLGVLYGHPVIVSEQMRLADTDGKVTDAGNVTDTGRILVVNRGQWRIGFRRELSIETERDIQKRQNVMVVSMRIALSERSGSRSSATHTALQYNVTGVV